MQDLRHWSLSRQDGWWEKLEELIVKEFFHFSILQHHLSSETFQSFTVATIILVNLIGTSMKTFVYCANRTILNEKVRGCWALPGQLLSIQFLFSSLESWHLKRYTSGLKKKREREKRKIENKSFDSESNTTNLSVDTFKHHDYQLNSFYCICGVLAVLCCFIAGIKLRALIYTRLYSHLYFNYQLSYSFK